MTTDTYTIEELKEYIASHVDEVTFLEMLDINTERLVEAFNDDIETRYDSIIEMLGLDGWEDGFNE